jgi:two-component system, cell cycle sensor histidine kinase and response regulator CckA
LFTISITRFEAGSIFLPQGDALQWQPQLVALYIIGDTLIAATYLMIAFTLVRLIRNHARLGLTFSVVLGLFAATLFAGAFMHATALVTMWDPRYGQSTVAKVITALISVTATIALLRAWPTLLRLPHAAQLRGEKATIETAVKTRTADLTAINDRLRNEIAQREDAEAEVRRLNAELEATVAEFQSLFKVLPVGVAITTDATCRAIRSNEAFAEMMGITTTRTLSLSSPPFEAPANVRVSHNGRELKVSELPMQRAVSENTRVRDFEQTITCPDGRSIEVLANAVPIRDAEGIPRGCVATFHDITAQKQAERKRLDLERRLLQSQKLESIGVLAGGIAHDFNNLLTGVLGHANFARGELARGSTNIDHLLAQVETSAQRAADLCRQLLAYAGKGRVVVRLIDLNVAVQQTLPLLNLSVTKKITVDLQLGAGLPPLRGDPSQIHQVLLNLVTNASEAIGTAAGNVTIRTERVNVTAMDMLTLTASPDMEPGTYICLEVRDTGCGIPPETIGHVFEPFFTTKFVGRGLGLAAVIGIVQGHRGGVRVSSQVGVGTTFELFFPVVATTTRATASGFGTTAPSRGMVLVVDDDATVREFVGTALLSAGYHVTTAVDGEDALLKLKQDPMQFDAVLLDLTMPKLDGEDTLMALRMIAPNLPVVLTSGYGEQAVVQRFVGRGLADFLPKPFMTEALVGVINTVVDRARAAAA